MSTDTNGDHIEGGPNSKLLPTFLIIGAPKAGTTSLYQYLRGHPDVFMSLVKEPNYFSKGVPMGEGLETYSRLFAGADGASAIGEASPSYAAFPTCGDVPARIAQVLPEVRLVYLVRHPIERMRSQYVMEVALGKKTCSIEEALLGDRRYLDFSRYAFQIQQYLPHFSRGQMLIVTSETLRDERRGTLHRVCEFLDLKADCWSSAVNEQFNESSSKGRPNVLNRTMRPVRRNPAYRAVASKAPRFVKSLNRRLMIRGIDPRTTAVPERLRRHLEALLRDDVRELHAFLGDDFDGWALT